MKCVFPFIFTNGRPVRPRLWCMKFNDYLNKFEWWKIGFKNHKEAHWWPSLVNPWSLLCVTVLLIHPNKFKFLKFYKPVVWTHFALGLRYLCTGASFLFSVLCLVGFTCLRTLSLPCLHVLVQNDIKNCLPASPLWKFNPLDHVAQNKCFITFFSINYYPLAVAIVLLLNVLQRPMYKFLCPRVARRQVEDSWRSLGP